MTPITPGALLAGRFRLEDLLEDAGGARFWRATDQILARDVAVHVVDATDRRAEALLRAARKSATVSSPHLLRVLDAAIEDGVAYVVNEWGNGVSLDRMLLEGPLPARQAAWMVREVADAIADAHARGVAHGRLIPENVMINDTGAVKLIGFVVDAVLHGRLEPGDARTDVRDLAALLYAALVGRWPGTPGTTLAAAPLDHGRVMRARQVRAGVPRELDRVCDSVLNESEAHFALSTAHEIRAALADFLGELGDSPAFGRRRADVEPTQRLLLPDPDATQAGIPRFDDDELEDDLEDGLGGGLADGRDDGRHDSRDDSTASHPGPLVGGAPGGALVPAAGADGGPGTGPMEPVSGSPAGPSADRTAGSSTDSSTGPPAEAYAELFAADDDRAFAAVSPGTPRTPFVGMGGGPAPDIWGPDAGQPGPDEDWEDEAPGTSWLKLAGLVGSGLILLFAVVFAFNLGRGDGDGDPAGPEPSLTATPAGEPVAVELAAVSDFDPFQDGGAPEENPEDVPLAHDGDPGTAWTTSRYNDGPDITVYKPGVGLLVDLGEEKPVTDVEIRLRGSGSRVVLFGAPSGAAAPTTTEGLQQLDVAADAGETVTLSGNDATTRYLVLWFTALPRVDGGYRGGIAEIVVRS